MSNEQPNHQKLNQYDGWLDDNSNVAAIVFQQWLVPIEGKESAVFPPTYNLERTEGARRFKGGEALPGFFLNSKDEAYGYNIDRFPNGASICQVDSVGSQANRIEPIFKRDEYRTLVPQIIVTAGTRRINLLDAGHRAADAIVRFSSLCGELESAFRAFLDDGNAEPLARLAPTSILFGAWDSRATQAKLPRVMRSVIRAYDVDTLHRSAQYVPPIDYVAEELLDAPATRQQQDSMSELGFSHAPAAWTHGGVIVRNGIRRDATLNLAALRALGASSPERTTALRRYILGLGLIAFTARQETFLREGCQLVLDRERPGECNLVRYDGSPEPFSLGHQAALDFARLAAQEFGVGQDRTDVTFNADAARQELGQTRAQRQTRRRRGRSTTQSEEPKSPTTAEEQQDQ